ncbi:MAG: hypothetical protein IH934_04780 [Nanoarchaeota archaeon]|nr:hypothetical protein [Nanoarchaeota archaeon]
MLQVFEYGKDKEGKEKSNAVDAISLLTTMTEFEEYIGTTKEKIVENWYSLKREVREAALALPPEQPKKDGK